MFTLTHLSFFLPATGVVSNHNLLMSVNSDFINNGFRFDKQFMNCYFYLWQQLYTRLPLSAVVSYN